MKDDQLKITMSSYTHQKLDLSLHVDRNKHLGVALNFCSIRFFEAQFIDSEGLRMCMVMHTAFQKQGSTLAGNVNAKLSSSPE
jgi:hypothetical protein